MSHRFIYSIPISFKLPSGKGFVLAEGFGKNPDQDLPSF